MNISPKAVTLMCASGIALIILTVIGLFLLSKAEPVAATQERAESLPYYCTEGYLLHWVVTGRHTDGIPSYELVNVRSEQGNAPIQCGAES